MCCILKVQTFGHTAGTLQAKLMQSTSWTWDFMFRSNSMHASYDVLSHSASRIDSDLIIYLNMYALNSSGTLVSELTHGESLLGDCCQHQLSASQDTYH